MKFTGSIDGQTYNIEAKPVFSEDGEQRLLGYALQVDADLTAAQVARALKGKL
jgi:hypothetical protein